MTHSLPDTPAAERIDPPCSLALNHPNSAGYAASAATIRRHYWQSHHAQLATTMPLLLSLSVDDQGVQAALGLRCAAVEPLFLEHYLDAPIESAIASAAAMPVLRERIVEIGNLVATRRTGSQQLFILMTAIVAAAGFQWMTFTATPQVAKLIGRLGYTPLDLGVAEPGRLADRGACWGNYFNTAPRLQAGRLSAAMAALNANPRCATLLAERQPIIAELAARLERACHRVD